VSELKVRADSGLTLVELLVSTLLVALVLTVVGGIFISVTSVQRTVGSLTSTTTAAQAAASAIEQGVRNASEISLTTPTGTDQLLVVRTANQTGTLTWTCRAWYYSATSGQIRSTATNNGTHITAPNSTALAAWPLLVSGVTPHSGTTVFTAAGDSVTIDYDVAVTTGPAVRIQTTALKRTGVVGVGTCF
jgi:Tfp pilus assembly protein PilW